MGRRQDQGPAGSPAQPGNGSGQSALPPSEGGKTAGWLLLVRLLLAVAVLGAGYMAYVSFSHGPVAGCGAGSGCDKVLQSRWAYWLGIPVSLPAVLVYLGLLAATVFAQKRPSWADQQRAWAVMIILSVVIAGAATWFIGLQAFVIESFCKFCMTAHTCGLIASVLCLKHIPTGAVVEASARLDRPQGFTASRKAILAFTGLGLACLAVLIGGQLLVQKQRNIVKPDPVISTNQLPLAPAAAITNRLPPVATNRPPSTNPVVTATPAVPISTPGRTNLPATTNALAATNPAPIPAPPPRTPPPAPPAARGMAQLLAPRLLSLYDGRFQFKLDEVPMMGSPDATNLVVSLFDYTCHHCRLLHPMLREAQHRFSNQLGIVSLPMPMATNCNPAIVRYMRPHANACEYAKLGLAVWRANPGAFAQFDDWLFTPAQIVPSDQAKQYAAQLVGADKLEKALADEWITQQIHTDGYLYHSNYLKMGNSILPELILGPVISFGPLNSVQDLYKLLDQHLGVK